MKMATNKETETGAARESAIEEARSKRDIQVAYDGDSIPARLFSYYRNQGLSYSEANIACARDIKAHKMSTKTQEQIEIRTCITCGDEFANRNTGMADHSQCYDCEADSDYDCAQSEGE